jgi:hypothetical protein
VCEAGYIGTRCDVVDTSGELNPLIVVWVLVVVVGLALVWCWRKVSVCSVFSESLREAAQRRINEVRLPTETDGWRGATGAEIEGHSVIHTFQKKKKKQKQTQEPANGSNIKVAASEDNGAHAQEVVISRRSVITTDSRAPIADQQSRRARPRAATGNKVAPVHQMSSTTTTSSTNHRITASVRNRIGSSGMVWTRHGYVGAADGRRFDRTAVDSLEDENTGDRAMPGMSRRNPRMYILNTNQGHFKGSSRKCSLLDCGLACARRKDGGGRVE